MKKFLQLAILLLAASAGARAQVVPAAVAGPASFGYSFNYAQTSEFGSDLSDWQTINANGNVHYRNGFQRHPFALNYAGGYTWTLTGPGYGNGFHQHLLASEGFVWRKWSIVVGDNISYTPQAPITGFPGISGTGTPIGGSNPDSGSDQDILTLKTRSVDNAVNANVAARIASGTSFNVGGGNSLLRYPDGNGIKIDGLFANVGLTERLNVRTSLVGSYAFSEFSYPDYNLKLTTSTAFFGIARNWSRKLSTSVNGGPQWASGSNSTLIPSSSGFAVNANARYRLRTLSAGLTYTRGVSGGSGYLLGAKSDIVSANVARGYGRNLTVGVQGSYRRVAGLTNNGAVTSEDFAVQANKRVGRHWTTFAGYTIINQGSDSHLPTNVLNNVLQSFSFGFGYSPREKHVNE